MLASWAGLYYNICNSKGNRKVANMSKKFKLVKADKVIKTPEGKVLKQLVALKDFGDVAKGQKGGYLESAKNLSQDGNCWVYDDACVFGTAVVSNDATVNGQSEVFGNARVFGRASITGKSKVYDNGNVCGAAMISSSTVRGEALIGGDAILNDGSDIYGNSLITYGYHCELSGIVELIRKP